METKDYKARKNLLDVSTLSGLFVAIIGLVVLIIGKEYSKYGIIIICAGIFIMLIMLWALSAYSITLSDKYLIVKSGIFSKRSEEISLNNIVSVKIDQSFFGRIFSFGDLTVDIVGKPAMMLPHIKDPVKLNDKLKEYLDKSNA